MLTTILVAIVTTLVFRRTGLRDHASGDIDSHAPHPVTDHGPTVATDRNQTQNRTADTTTKGELWN